MYYKRLLQPLWKSAGRYGKQTKQDDHVTQLCHSWGVPKGVQLYMSQGHRTPVSIALLASVDTYRASR